MMKRPPERRLRVYQQWQGNERFFCWGHCVTGPSWKSGLGSLVLLIAPTVIFLVFVAPYMADRVSPAILSIRDPGVLPRQEPDEEWLQGRKPRAKDVCVNDHRVTVRYNDTCHFYQPPRAHHCSVNDNCIERFDHHCPWVGTTIGKRNYRTFLLFIYGTSVYIAWTFGVSMGSLFVRHAELERQQQQQHGAQQADTMSSNLWLQALSQSGAAIALMIFTFIFFWFVCGLSGFHTWLVATNQTTYENFRYNHNQVPNPYNEGCLRNCASVWCLPIPPSKVQFRSYIDQVSKQPVELGFPEWSSSSTTAATAPGVAAMSSSAAALRSEPVVGMLPGSAAAAPAAAAGGPEVGGVLAGGGGQLEAADGGASAPPQVGVKRFLGRGEAMLPVQGYDSVTDGSSEIPINRSDTRGETRAVSYLAAGVASGSSSSSSSGGGGGTGWGGQAGQLGLRGGSAGGAVVNSSSGNNNAEGRVVGQQQLTSEEQVSIEMAGAAGGWQQQQQQQQGWGAGGRVGSGGLAAPGPLGHEYGYPTQQQQQQYYGNLQQQQQQPQYVNGDGAAVSCPLTEYEDAVGAQSEGSWASREGSDGPASSSLVLPVQHGGGAGAGGAGGGHP